MDLKTLIQGSSLIGDAADIAATLNAKTISQVQPEISSKGIAKADKSLSAKIREEMEFALASLSAMPRDKGQLDELYYNVKNFMGWWNSATPIDFSDAELGAAIGGLVALKLLSTETAAAMGELGVNQISLCEQAGLPEATEAEVQVAVDAIANESKRKRLDGILDGIKVTFDLNPDTTFVDAVNQLARGLLTEKQAEAVAKVLEK